MGQNTFQIPGAAWLHHFAEPFDSVRKTSRNIPALQVIKMLPMIVRMLNYTRKRKNGGFDPISMSPTLAVEPYQGVPLGGIGAGSIGRGWRGEFRRWQIRSGFVQNQPVWADQFSLYVKRDGQPATTQVLFPTNESEHLKAWEWELPLFCATYQALFPRAWTTYDEPQPGVRLTCRQLSPVIAGNYQETSFPVSEFRWKIENSGEEAATVALMFTFQNGMGTLNDRAGEHYNHVFQVDGITGVTLKHAYRQKQSSETLPASQRATFEDPLTFAIAAHPLQGGEVTYCARFVTSGDGAEIWNDFKSDGRLDDLQDERPSVTGESIGAGIAVRVRLGPGESREVGFSLAWDMPVIRFGYGTSYYRHYTHFYGCSGEAAARMAADALLHADKWEAKIEKWQSPILQNEELPIWYRQALFNELYYLVDGGTVWARPVQGAALDAEMGHFAYLEGLEYRMYNTYDVHFYASFALAQLWPRLELALQRDMAQATLAESTETFTEVFSGKRAPRKLRGAVPHDLGWPDEDPWEKLNGYFVHNVNDWKDLNAKFILQIYRDFIATGDQQFAQETWPAVEEALRRLQRFDRDNDGVIENDGFPDQTYDVWTVKGISAYTGGLWLACLAAAAELSTLAGKPEFALECRETFEKGKQAYDSQLWNGRYFNYDSSRGKQHDSIMADQMAGQWYARACGLPCIVDPLRARSALATVFDWNVMRFRAGSMGAVNGMRPDGTVDESNLQSSEVWTGTTYAVAAAMLQEGLLEAGFQTAEGVYRTIYEKNGYWFQTPEAYDYQGNYRSICYMRPLAIWAMQWAIERRWERRLLA